MNERIINQFEEKAKNYASNYEIGSPMWFHFYNKKFAELIVQECISSVGSQADKAYLRKHFGLPVESDVVYPATDESWSVETQYKRKYNIAPGPRDNPNLGGI